jgi:hypothetical protein
MITAVMIDTREPQWVQSLTFGGVPTAVLELATGDVHALTEDGCTLMIERKTPEDLLNSLRDDRLLPQCARLVETRLDEQAACGAFTSWPYLVISGLIYRGPGGKVFTGDRGSTGWSWDALQGALLTIQEMGVMVVFCGEDADFEKCVIRLANRKRDAIKLIPPRPPSIVGPGAAFLASLPGVGIEHTLKLLEWTNNQPGHAIAGITDLEIECPLPMATRKRIRAMLGLREKQQIDLWINSKQDEILDVTERT